MTLVDQFADAVERAILAAQGGENTLFDEGEFPQDQWDAFTAALERNLGPEWQVRYIGPPTQIRSLTGIHIPTNTTVSATIEADTRDGKPIYRQTAIGEP
jgi:hypothetical protein